MRFHHSLRSGFALTGFSPALAAALAGPLVAAAGLMVWEEHKRELTALALNLIKCSIAACLFIAVAYLQADVDEVHPPVLGALALSSLVGIVIGDVFWIEAFERLGTRTTALLGTAQPLLAALVGSVVLAQPLTVTTLAGMLLISTGIVLAEGAGEAGQDERRGWDAHRRSGFMCAALSICCDLLGTLITQQHAACLSTWTINACRFGFATAALFLLFGAARLHSSLLPLGVREWARLQASPLPPFGRRQWGWIVVGCVLATFAWSALSAFALLRLSLGVWQALNSLVPVHTVLLHRLWNGKWSSHRAILGAFVASAGAAILAHGKHGHHPCQLAAPPRESSDASTAYSDDSGIAQRVLSERTSIHLWRQSIQPQPLSLCICLRRGKNPFCLSPYQASNQLCPRSSPACGFLVAHGLNRLARRGAMHFQYASGRVSAALQRCPSLLFEGIPELPLDQIRKEIKCAIAHKSTLPTCAKLAHSHDALPATWVIRPNPLELPEDLLQRGRVAADWVVKICPFESGVHRRHQFEHGSRGVTFMRGQFDRSLMLEALGRIGKVLNASAESFTCAIVQAPPASRLAVQHVQPTLSYSSRHASKQSVTDGRVWVMLAASGGRVRGFMHLNTTYLKLTKPMREIHTIEDKYMPCHQANIQELNGGPRARWNCLADPSAQPWSDRYRQVTLPRLVRSAPKLLPSSFLRRCAPSFSFPPGENHCRAAFGG